MRLLFVIFLMTLSLLANNLQKISLQLSWFNQFQFAGYYIAKEKGFYEAVGLDVEIKPFDFNVNIPEDVNSEKIDFGIGRETLILDSVDKKLVFLSAIFQSSPLMLLSTQNSNINSLKDFSNKKLMATLDDANEVSLKAMMSSQGVPLSSATCIKHTHNIEDLIKGNTDIISAYISKAPFDLQEKGIKYNIFHPKDFGFDMYSDFLFTSHVFINKNPAIASTFRDASLAGWEYAYNNIEEAVDIILEKYNTQNLSREALLFEAKELKKLSFYKTDKIGSIHKAKFQRIYDLYNIMGFIKQPINLDSLIYEGSYELFLTNKEKQWIDDNSVIKYSFLPYPPLAMVSDSQPRGMIKDILDIISRKVGLTFVFSPSKSYEEMHDKFISKEIHFIPSINSDFEKLLNGIKTNDHEDYPMVVVTKNKEKYAFIENLSELNGKTVSVQKNFDATSYIQENYPKILLHLTKSEEEAIALVANGKVEAFVGHIASALYYLSSQELTDIKISGIVDFNYTHKLLVQKDLPILVSILNKAFSSINHKDKDAIYQKWTSIKPLKKTNLLIIWTIIICFTLSIFFILYKYFKLEKHTQKLKENANILSLSIEGNKEGIFDWNIIDDTTYISPRWKEIIGYKDDELENNFDVWKERIHPDDYNTVMFAVQEHFEGKRKYFDNLHRMKHKDGHWVWIYARGICQKDEKGNVVRLTGTHLDISNDKEMQLKIQQQTQIIQEVHDSIISMDIDGFILDWNQGSVNMFGYLNSEIIGKHISILYPTNVHAVVEKNINQLLEDNHFDTEVYLLTKSLDKIYVELTLSTFKDRSGSIISLIVYCKDITDKKRAEENLIMQKEKLDYQAHHDMLTGLPNRLLFEDRLQQLIRSASRNKSKFALYFIDLDKFKDINDSLGHDIGDIVLEKIAKTIQKSLRDEDTVARVSGDEFIALVTNLEDTNYASIIAKKINENIRKPILINNNTLAITASIGIAIYPDTTKDFKELIKYADTAMYKVKNTTKNNFQFYSN